jgi:amidase
VQFEEYVRHDATSLAELVRTKEVSPRELLEACLSRLDAVNPSIRAVIHRLEASAWRTVEHLPEGPLRGVPFLVKDLDGSLAGAPLNMGCRALRDYIAPHDSELFARFKRAGVVIAGKTNTPEFGIVAVTEPELHGPTRNPWNTSYIPGGSSGGSAAAVAAGIVPVAHAGDGGGSIRIPASACGLFGLKPTRGRMPMGPDVSESWHGFVVPHVVTRSVRDSALFLDATHGPDIGAPYVAPGYTGRFVDEVSREPSRLRVGFTTRSILGSATDAECARACTDAVKVLSSMGHDVSEVSLPIDVEAVRVAYLTVVASGVAEAVRQTGVLIGRTPTPDGFEATTWFLSQVGNALRASDLERARTTLARTQRSVGALFENIDVLVTPTLAHPPSKVGELAPKTHERIGMRLLRGTDNRAVLKKVLDAFAQNALEKTPNTMLFNITGQPAMSLPLHWNVEGLPIGVQVVGKFGDEATLFRVAGVFERERPWFAHRPAL